MTFPCTKCGQCCRLAGQVITPSSEAYKAAPTVIKDLIDRFPYEINEDGSCSKLTAEGTCSVYDNRPIICNIELMGQLLNTNLNDWYKVQANNCNLLIKQAGLSDDYLGEI